MLFNEWKVWCLKKYWSPCRNCLREHLKRVNYQVGIRKITHIARPLYPEPTHENGWQCVDVMIEPKWVSGDFIPKQLADVLVEENIAGLTESDASDDEFDDVYTRWLMVMRKTSENCFAKFQYCLAVCNTHCSGHLLKNETEIWKYWVYHVYLSQFSSRGREEGVEFG